MQYNSIIPALRFDQIFGVICSDINQFIQTRKIFARRCWELVMTSTCLPPFSYVKASEPGKVANACVSLHRSLPFIVMNTICCIAASLALS